MNEMNEWLIYDWYNYIIKWLVIYIKRDWRQLYNNLYIDKEHSLMIILYCLLTTLNTNQIPLNKQLHI
jgi:hypothetical protein